MGFLAGVTGGITITLSLAYLALQSHQRNRESQSDILRSQTRVLNVLSRDPSLSGHSRHQPDDALYPPSRAELAARHRTHFVETAKDRWNAEVEGAVRWAQNTNWTSVREDVEDRLLGIAKAMPDTTEVRHKAAGVAEQVKEDAKGVVAKGKEMVGRAKAAVYLAEEKAETKLDAKLLHLSEVEKALRQRYERDESVMKKSVQEVLAERYKPIGERDNTRLRGI